MCVSDIERSRRFYCDALGFRCAERYFFEEGPGQLMEIEENPRFASQFLRLDGFRLELISFEEPRASGSRCRMPMNTLGFTHLAVRVSDFDSVLQDVVRCGGQVLRHTRTRVPMEGYDCEMIYCVDPDGQRIELLWMPEHIEME